jgi:hypothetical protein
MTSWRWFEVFPPRGMTLEDSTAVVRVLAGRPRLGALGLQPLVVFEFWITRERVRWLMGADAQIAGRLPGELRAQYPGLVVVPVDDPERTPLITGREVRFRSLAYPVRLDTAESVTAALLHSGDGLHSGEAVVVQFVVGPGQSFTAYPQRQRPLDMLGFTTPPEPDSSDRQAWRRKLGEPLFAVRGRVGAATADPRRGAVITRPILAALALANDRQGRMQTSAQSSRIGGQVGRVMGRVRTWSSILNAAELAVMLGWNVGERTVAQSGNGFGPPPPVLLAAAGSMPAAERVAGVSTHPAARGRAVRLPLSAYRAHLHVIGPSGSGKSTALAQWAVAEAEAGRSLVLIEPKGDLVADVLARLPARRHGDVVVLDPGGDAGLPVVGFNPLKGPRADAERRADALLGLFKELFGSAVGPRSSDVLLHALIAISRLEDGALTDVLPFLTNPRFRRWVLGRVGDPLTLAPWAAWFDSLSDAERGQVVAPLGNKLRVVSARPSVRRLLGQPSPAFALDTVFARPTLLLVNLNAGAVGPEAAKLVGTLLLNQLWDVIQRQTLKAERARRVVPVIVDEFQGFTAGLDFADVLARARGAGAPFTIAHQHLDQLSPSLRAAVLANARSRLAFKPAESDGRALAAALGSPVRPDDLERLAAYHAVGRVLVDGTPSPAFEIATLPLPVPTHDPDAVRRASLERYGADPAAVDAAILARWQGGGQDPDGPIGVRRKQP